MHPPERPPAQNIYDDPEFLAGYSTLDRQQRGLDGAAEWPAMRAMVPALSGSRVVDLGCGYGWLSRWAHEQGARDVLGIDLSERMLAVARETGPAGIEYRRADLDTVELPAGSFDVAISSLALHYVHDLDRLLAELSASLVPGGRLVFSVEHPIYSAPSRQEFDVTADGARSWPLTDYLVEGVRSTTWYVDGVIKVHRTVATYVNSLIRAGFVLDQLDEWGPSPEQVAERPELVDDLHRPWFLLVAASRSVTAPA